MFLNDSLSEETREREQAANDKLFSLSYGQLSESGNRETIVRSGIAKHASINVRIGRFTVSFVLLFRDA